MFKIKENNDLEQVVTYNIPQMCRVWIYFSRWESCGEVVIVSGYVRIVSSPYTVQCNSAGSYQNIELNALSFVGHSKELSELQQMPKYLYASCSCLSW